MTGASRGIGAAIALLAGERGYAVAVNFATSEAEAREVVVDEIVARGGRAIGDSVPMSHVKRRSCGCSRRRSANWVRSRGW